MLRWNEAIQRIVDWLERHLDDAPTLLELSRQVGYSPYYCSAQFHRLTGVTLRSYIAGRKLSRVAVELRDGDARILDIAVKYGFSSQQALARAFAEAFGCTPAAYRKRPVPLRLAIKKNVLFPEHYPVEEETIMTAITPTEPSVRVEYIPAHRFLCVRDPEVQAYFPFWERHNCDQVTGVIDSMEHVAHPVVGTHTGGWFWTGGKRGYTYGFGVAEDYDGEVPEGFEVLRYPGSYYLVFGHPPFDYLKDCERVFERVEGLAFGFDPATRGFAWNEEVCQLYQRMQPETMGYEVLRPVKKI